MPKCWPTYNRHNKLSSNGRTMNECCSTNYSTIALTEESTTDAEKIITWTDGHKIGQLTKKGQYRRGLGWWTADCRPNNPILASKTVSHCIKFSLTDYACKLCIRPRYDLSNINHNFKTIPPKTSYSDKFWKQRSNFAFEAVRVIRTNPRCKINMGMHSSTS